MLKNILMPNQDTPEVEYGSDSPTVACEACGTPGPSHLMINSMLQVGSPGHPSLPPFRCPEIEHWACTPECWLKVTHACVDEHMYELLKYYRSTVNL